jgi:hypothetical protein
MRDFYEPPLREQRICIRFAILGLVIIAATTAYALVFTN